MTEGLEAFAPRPAAEDGTPGWGRWFRDIDVTPDARRAGGDGRAPTGRPLLLLGRVGEGRAALLASDHAWLWDRGFEGGGPQLELLRRLAHWLMQEPELEEEALWAEPHGAVACGSSAGRWPRTVPDAVVTGPDGTETTVPLDRGVAGPLRGGLGRARDGPLPDRRRRPGGGDRARPRRAARVRGDHRHAATCCGRRWTRRRAAIVRIEDGLPDLREVREGRPAAGRGWIGITPREAYRDRRHLGAGAAAGLGVPADGLAADPRAPGCARGGAREAGGPAGAPRAGRGQEAIDALIEASITRCVSISVTATIAAPLAIGSVPLAA